MHLANKQEYHVRTDVETFTCNIEGVCWLPNGSVLISDTKNVSVKLLDSSFNVCSKYHPPVPPFGVCVINADQAAVTLRSNKTVELLSIGKDIFRTGVISLDHGCYGITYNQGKLFISDPGDNFLSDGLVYAYSVSGERLKVFNKDHTKRDIFSRPGHIAVSSCGKKVYAADLDFGLISIDEQSKVSKLKPKDFVGAIGLCLIDDNCILVSGLSSHNVVKVDIRDNSVIDYVVPASAGLYEPIALCADMHRSKLILAVKNSDVIIVYDLIQ